MSIKIIFGRQFLESDDLRLVQDGFQYADESQFWECSVFMTEDEHSSTVWVGEVVTEVEDGDFDLNALHADEALIERVTHKISLAIEENPELQPLLSSLHFWAVKEN